MIITLSVGNTSRLAGRLLRFLLLRNALLDGCPGSGDGKSLSG